MRRGLVVTGRFARKAAVSVLTVLLMTTVLVSPVRAESLRVVASFSVLADMVRTVAGERATVMSLVGVNEDPHIFRPTPDDLRKVARANLVFVNGAGFEGWLDRVVRASGFTGDVVTVTHGLALQPLGGEPLGTGKRKGRAHKSGDKTGDRTGDRHSPSAADHAHPRPFKHPRRRPRDPHAWHDPTLAVEYVGRIEAALTKADPDGKAYYAAAARAYQQEILSVVASMRDRLHAIEETHRRIVTPHDGFGYLGRAFGITIFATSPVASEGESSAARIAALTRVVRKQRVRAVFVENTANPRLMNQLSAETGVAVGGTLYSDALSDRTGDAPTYLALLRHNLTAIADALGAPQ